MEIEITKTGCSKFVINEINGKYSVNRELTEDDILEMALAISKSKLAKGIQISSSHTVMKYLQTYLQGYDYEVFGVIFLDTKNRIIETKIMFRGSINSASVYPRDVAKEALLNNCNSVIFFHCHPSGDPTPSSADKHITKRLVDSLSLFDIDTLDHIVVGSEGTYSFKERGLL